jgi:ribosome-associated protein
VTAAPHDDPADADDTVQPPSKSARKRAAHDAQHLGEALVRLRDAELDALQLPQVLSEAIRAARNITSRAAAARQRQYIGKLMRAVEVEPIRAALAAHSERAARESERFKRVSAWRERLIAEGPTALAELARWRPDLDRAQWARRVGAAQAERHRAAGAGAAARELFRALRALFDTMP